MDTSRAPTYYVERYKDLDNGIGGNIEKWDAHKIIKGWLDSVQGYGANMEGVFLNAFLQDSTHILITDYTTDITNKDRLRDNADNIYNIILIDDPVNINHHLEIYLKFTGNKNEL